MEEKFCNGCQTSKLISEFWIKHNKLQARCKECQKVYHKQHYKDNIENYKDRAKKRNQKIVESVRKFIQEQKDKPCQDCGTKYPYYVMDFDHRPGEKKIFNLAKIARVKPSLDLVIEEIAKCDVVCSNCHRIRTYNRTKMLCPKG